MATVTLQTPKAAKIALDTITTKIGQVPQYVPQAFSSGQAANNIQQLSRLSSGKIMQIGRSLSGVTQPVNRLPFPTAVIPTQSAGLLGRVAQVASAAAPIISKVNTAATIAQGAVTGFQIGQAGMELYEAQLGIDVSKSALELATQELRLQQARTDRGLNTPTTTRPRSPQEIPTQIPEQNIDPFDISRILNPPSPVQTPVKPPTWNDPLELGQFTQTPTWQPQLYPPPPTTSAPPVAPPVQAPPLVPPGVPILDTPTPITPEIQTPTRTPTPVVQVGTPTEPDLSKGFGGVNLNWPIYQLLQQIAGGILQGQQPDLSQIISRLDAIASSLPPIMESLSGISQALIAIPPNIWELIKNPLAEMLKVTGQTTFTTTTNEVTGILQSALTTATTHITTATSSAIGSMLYPILVGVYTGHQLTNAVGVALSRQNLTSAIALPAVQTLSAVLPATQSLSAVLPVAQSLSAVLPVAQSLSAVLPVSQSLAAVIPTATQLDFSPLAQQVTSLQIGLQTALQAQIELGNGLKTLRDIQAKCCKTIDDLSNDHKKLQNKVKIEFDKNKERFKQDTHTIELICDPNNPEEMPLTFSGAGVAMPGISAQFKTLTGMLTQIYKRVCDVELSDLIEGSISLLCPAEGEGEEEPKTEAIYSGSGLIGLSAQLQANTELIRRVLKYVCPLDMEGSISLLCPEPYSEGDAKPTAADWQGKGILAISNQIQALTTLNYEILRAACNVEVDYPEIITVGYETHLDEFPITKTLELKFGEEYPTQKGSLWNLKIPYPKGEFTTSEEGLLHGYSEFTWDDFEDLTRYHGSAYCRLSLANSARFMAVYADTEDGGKEFLQRIYNRFVDSAIAPPSGLDGSGGPYVRTNGGTRPKRNPKNGITRCVRATITEFDDNGEPTRYCVWYPPEV